MQTIKRKEAKKLPFGHFSSMPPSLVVPSKSISSSTIGSEEGACTAAGGQVVLAGTAIGRGRCDPVATVFFFFASTAVLTAALAVGRRSLLPVILAKVGTVVTRSRRIRGRRWVSGASAGVQGCGGGRPIHSAGHRGRGWPAAVTGAAASGWAGRQCASGWVGHLSTCKQ